MFKNYLKTAFRNLLRYKGFSAINIASLTIGVIGCLIIALFVWDEWQFDRFVKDGDRIYRIYNQRTDNQGTNNVAVVPPIYAAYIQQQYPEVDTTLRIIMLGGKVLTEVGDAKSYEEKYMVTEPDFFSFFPLRLLEGDPKTALTDPTSIVITQELAKKYFGSQNPMGKTIKINKTDMLVKGILAPLPAHFHLDFKFLMPLASLQLPKERMQSWQWNQFYTYVKVKLGTNMALLQNKFAAAVAKETETEARESGTKSQPRFQALKNIHLQSADFLFDNAKRGNQTYVKSLIVIALFVLVIACFNFINLATARSLRRAKEIGVRKVVGAERTQLMAQFTFETVLLSILSVLIAGIVTVLLVPALNRFTDKAISFNFFTHPLLALMLLAAGVVIGIVAGIYPAFILSGFQPIKVLKGMNLKLANNRQGLLREGLVVIQFALSALLIVCMLVVYQQVHYLHKKDLGFNKDQVLSFQLPNELIPKLPSFKAELLRSPDIVSATAGYGLPGDIFAGDQILVPKEGDKKYPTSLFLVDEDYIPTLGLQLVAGRNFSKNLSTDKDQAFIINQTAVKEFGFGTPKRALGQAIHWPKWEADSLNPIKKGLVIGVVKDFHYKSLHEKVAPLVLQIYPEYYKMAVKIHSADMDRTVRYIKSVWSKYIPDPLDYAFLDESFDAMYKAEDKLGTLLLIFTIMAISIACMGLFGLAAFSAEERVKEIGIRKVLGASVLNITALLSKGFVRLVLVASVLALPVAWWAMSRWLQDFSYRIIIHWWVFALAGILSMVIALITVSFQAIKAATANPVKSLRTE